MSSPVTVKQETMPTTVSPPSSNDKNIGHSTVLTIDTYTDPNVIKAIPFEDTWATYIHNASNPIYSENEWDSMSLDEKHNELFLLKPTEIILFSPFTTITISANTPDGHIRKISKKDCRHLLLAYANNRGFPQYATHIEVC